MAALAASLTGAAGGAMAQEAAPPEPAVSLAPAAPIAPWYQEYAQSADQYDLAGYPLSQRAPSVELEAGKGWGFSFGIGSAGGPTRDELDSLSAGAFFDVSPRMRVGGEFAVRAAQENGVALRPAEESSPQIKLESAFRF